MSDHVPDLLHRLLRPLAAALLGLFRSVGRFLLGMLKTLFILGMVGGLAGSVITGFVIYYYNRQLPKDLTAVADYQPRSLSQVFSEDGELIGEFFLERRIVVPLSRISPTVINAFLAAEDARFYQHQGIDPLGIARAFLTNLQAGRVVQGGSTITQQVVKNLLLSSERSLARKVKEAILSFRIERELTKDQILNTYLNMVYLGHGSYGIEAAAQSYFGRSASDLTLAEAAMLAGLVKAPTTNSPYLRFQRAKERQQYVLERMVAGGFVTAEQARRAAEEPINILSTPDVNNQAAPYFVEHVRRLVMARYGGNQLYRHGLRIETTLRMDWQRAARLAVRNGIDAMTGRQGYQGPDGFLPPEAWDRFRQETWKEMRDQRLMEGRPLPPDAGPQPGEIYPAIVLSNSKGRIRIGLGPEEVELASEDLQTRVPRLKDDSWTYKTVQSVLEPGAVLRVKYLGRTEKEPPKGAPLPPARVTLEGVPAAQGAMIVLEPRTGYIRAMVGGYDFRQSRFNRAVQSRRQPGSSFKPFIYAAALEGGMNQMSLVVDAPISFRVAGGRVWTPRNYGARYYGTVTLRTALTKSLNTVSVKLLNQYGVDSAIRIARRLGIKSPLATNLSLALGSSDVSLLELTTAYAGIAGNGLAVEPIAIKRITDAEGHVLEDKGHLQEDDDVSLEDLSELALPARASPRHALDPATAHVLTDMMKSVVESGTAQRVKALGRPVAGKTGTTNGYVDAWFVGFTPDLVAGVWVGTDTRNPLGKDETGGKAAAPIWLEFVAQALKDAPPKDFDVPPGVVFAQVDPTTGDPSTGADARYLPFKLETLPEAYLPRLTSRDPADDLE